MQGLAEVSVLLCYAVDRFDGGVVHDSGIHKVDDNMPRIILIVELLLEVGYRAEKERAVDAVYTGALFIITSRYGDLLSLLPGKLKGLEYDSNHNGHGQIMPYGYDGDHKDNKKIVQGNLLAELEGFPFKGSYNNHKHNTHKSGKGDDVDQGGAEHDKEHQRNRCNGTGNTGTAT